MTTGRWRRCHLRLPCLAEEGRGGGCLHTIATHVDRNNIALPRWRSVETGTIRRSPNAGAGEIIRRQRHQDLPRPMGHDVPIDAPAYALLRAALTDRTPAVQMLRKASWRGRVVLDL